MTPSPPPRVTERDSARLVAWSDEMRAVHDRLRGALRLTQEAVAEGRDPSPASADLLLFCHGFCGALTRHHEGEDRLLFPALAAAHPALADTLRSLQQDHSMIAHLVHALDADRASGADPAVLARHLEGIAAIMESHFRYEERALSHVLQGLDLEATVEEVFGPL